MLFWRAGGGLLTATMHCRRVLAVYIAMIVLLAGQRSVSAQTGNQTTTHSADETGNALKTDNNTAWCNASLSSAQEELSVMVAVLASIRAALARSEENLAGAHTAIRDLQEPASALTSTNALIGNCQRFLVSNKTALSTCRAALEMAGNSTVPPNHLPVKTRPAGDTTPCGIPRGGGTTTETTNIYYIISAAQPVGLCAHAALALAVIVIGAAARFA
jgi:uncharacterized protein YceK